MSSGPNWPGANQEIRLPKLPKLPKLPGQTVGIFVVLVVVLLVAFNSLYQVGPEEEALKLRLGRFTGETYGPGLHAVIPFIEQIRLVPLRRQLKQEFGFRTLSAARQTQYDTGNYKRESLMLTGDLNVADVEWIVQYKIGDPYKFLFKVDDVEGTFRDLSEAVMRAVIGDHSVDEVLTIGRTKIAADAKIMLQDLCDKYDTGIRVEQVVLQDVNPPEQVKPSFNEVNQAIQEKEQLMNMARAEYNKAVPRAQGEAEQQIRRAEGYALERVNNAEGDASRFLALYEEYRKAPKVTRRRIYLETISKVFPRLGEKIVVDEKLKNMLPVINLSGQGAILPAAAATKGGVK